LTHPAESRPGNRKKDRIARYRADRSFTEADLRRMLEHATGYRKDIVEPDDLARLLVVVTAYPAEQ